MLKITCMKKIFFLSAAVITLSVFFMCSSCKKTTHTPNPTPGNYRMMSYDKISKDNTVDEKYTFTYDANNRVSVIIYSTNDATSFVVGERILFKYVGDSIYKTIYNIKTNKLLESDTFIQNTSGQIIAAYNPGSTYAFQYYGNLMARDTIVYRDSGTTIMAVKTYTSDNADLLANYFDGNLYATFADTGFKASAVVNDTDFSTPFTATWVAGTNQLITPTITFPHTGIASYRDVLTGYDMGGPVSLSAQDGNGVSTRATCVFADDLWASELYLVWPDKTNRTGDYFQLGSFTTYGVNIFPNAHLLRSILNPGKNAYFTYDIDADSKITQTTAVFRDSLTHVKSTVIYRIQYQTY